MSLTKKWATLASGAVVGVVAFAGCSSSVTTTPNDAGSDVVIIHRSEAGTGDDGSSGEAGVNSMFDGTTGQPCTMDAECHAAGGPGINVCSNHLFTAGNAIFPSAVCMSKEPCTVPSDGSIAFCDDPDPNSPPGICVGAQGSMTGTCWPVCQFDNSGAAPTGCVGKDACNPFGFGTDPSGNPIGIGFCQGGCAADGDCPSGQHPCQTTKAPAGLAVMPPTCPWYVVRPDRYAGNAPAWRSLRRLHQGLLLIVLHGGQHGLPLGLRVRCSGAPGAHAS